MKSSEKPKAVLAMTKVEVKFKIFRFDHLLGVCTMHYYGNRGVWGSPVLDTVSCESQGSRPGSLGSLKDESKSVFKIFRPMVSRLQRNPEIVPLLPQPLSLRARHILFLPLERVKEFNDPMLYKQGE